MIQTKADMKRGSPVNAVGVHTTGQTIMKGMHWSKLQVTVECEEDRYTTQTWIFSKSLFFPSDPLDNHMTIFVAFY